MAIPPEILAVPRPTNSIVYAYGKNKDKYGVRIRIGCVRKNGQNHPVNGPTVGHIVGFKYVPLPEEEIESVKYAEISMKDWGALELCDRIARGLLDELMQFYNRHDALVIYCIAILRVCYPGIKDYELKDYYEKSFLSEIYPGVALSRNTVSAFIADVGKACSRIRSFMQARTAAVRADHHLIVDGTLKSNESKVNSLSQFSRKARTKGTRDISLLYAFDLEEMEPVCSQCFPGNMIDSVSYDSFIADNGITKGIIIGDKAFPSLMAKRHFLANRDLHFLNPLKRNSKYYGQLELHKYTIILKGFDDITCQKAYSGADKKWLYAFRDAEQAGKEEREFLAKAKRKGQYDDAELNAKRVRFGTILLESDLDMAPDVAYKAYATRWQIELVMRYYKVTCNFDETRVHSDYSVIASEFCNFLSTVITWKLIKRFDQSRLLEKMTYKKLMKMLVSSKKVKWHGKSWLPAKLMPSEEAIFKELELLPKENMTTKRRPGRPRKKVA